MFRYRVILCIKERTCCLIQPLHLTRSYELCFTKFHTDKTKQYCTSIKDKRQRRKMVNISKMNDIHIKEPIETDFENMSKHENFLKTNLCKESKHRQSENEANVTNETSESMNTVSYRDLHAMYPNPSHIVHNFYNLVNRELNDNSVLNVHYKRNSSKNSPWKCIYSVSWPEKQEFITFSVSKVAASKQAALKCLNWLHVQQKIKDSKPVIYSDEEIQKKLHKAIPIHFNFEFFEEVKKLLNTYETDIQDIILYSELNGDTSNFTSSTKDFIYRNSPSLLQCAARNKELQDRLLQNNINKKNTLPIFEYRDEILQKLENNRVIVIKGDTGCGKTTQVPQFIIDSFINDGNATDCNILVSQPRRISAISLAERVAFERAENVGDTVGYYVRLEAQPPQFPGGMMFCTTGILRQLIQVNPNLTGYSHVILDEAHERSLDIDVLLVLLKRAMQNNPTLKLVVMSATINTDLFQEFYNCISIDIPGKVYPVKMHLMEDFQHVLPPSETKENINQIDDRPIVDCHHVANLISWILQTKPPGTILCFLPGWMEIMKVNEMLTSEKSVAQKVLILPLHSKLSNINQRKIFKPAPPNITKVILATDIAETGITVPDVVYVVDSAVKNDFSWDERKFSLCMNYQKVSQANIQQRKGRAGRTQPGESYHFVRKEEYDYLDPYVIPEILRSSLEKTVVEIKTYTNEKVSVFCGSMLQPPSEKALHKAVITLRHLNILDKHENLTPLGKLVARIPVHPTLGKALVLSTVFQCFQPILHISTIYSMDKDLFSNTLESKALKKDIKKRYHKTSDLLAVAMLYAKGTESFNESDYGRDIFCNENNITPSKLRLASKTCNQFVRNLKECNLLKNRDLDDSEMSPNKYAFSEEIINGIILSSTNKLLQYRNYCFYKGLFKKRSQLLTENNELAQISSSSVNYGMKSYPSPFFTYLHGIHLHNRPYMSISDCSMLSPLTMLLFSRSEMYYKADDSGDIGNIILNIGRRRKLLFSCTSEEARVLMSFRDVIWSVMDYFIRNKCSNVDFNDELDIMNEYRSDVLNVLSKMLSVNDKTEE